jgi:hypothetical protein
VDLATNVSQFRGGIISNRPLFFSVNIMMSSNDAHSSAVSYKTRIVGKK